MKHKIILCSESLKPSKPKESTLEKYSVDGEAIAGLLGNNILALKERRVEIQAVGFNGRTEFMREVPRFVLNKIKEYRYYAQPVQLFIVAVRDSDSNETKKINATRRQLLDKLKKLRLKKDEFERIHLLFAVQAVEAWLLADEQKLNEYLGVTNKAKHENDPEAIANPKQLVQNLFAQCGQTYIPNHLLNLLPELRISELLRCRHFKALYDCIENICSAA